MRRVHFLVILLLIVSLPIFAQSSGGSVSGRVVDSTGAALPGVTITATNAATGFNRTTVTGSDGGFRFVALPIGNYTVVADLSGFNPVTTTDVVVNVASDTNVNVTLKQAAVRESITVTAEAPLVSTTPSVGAVISQQELQDR